MGERLIYVEDEEWYPVTTFRDAPEGSTDGYPADEATLARWEAGFAAFQALQDEIDAFAKAAHAAAKAKGEAGR